MFKQSKPALTMLVAAVAVTLVWGTLSHSAPPPGKGGGKGGGGGPPPDPAIAFAAGFSHSNDLMVINADGSNPTVLLTSEIDVFLSPAWSPDLDPQTEGFQGSLVYERSNLGRFAPGVKLFSLWLIDVVVTDSGVVQGENDRLLLDDAFLAAWSPRGDLIAYVGEYPQPQSIFVIDPTGGEPTLVVQDPTPDGSYLTVGWPAWSPDGTQLAYRYDGTIVIKDVVDPVTGNLLVDGEESVVAIGGGRDLDWSRSGRFLADKPSRQGLLRIIDLWDPPEEVLLPETDWEESPTWPPFWDTELVFIKVGAGAGKRMIVKRDLDTGEETLLYKRKSFHLWEPDWRRF